MLNLSSYYGVPVIVSARTMVDQGGGTQRALTRNDICGLLSLKKEKEEEAEGPEGPEELEKESGLFFKI